MKIEIEVNGYELHMLEKALNMAQKSGMAEQRRQGQFFKQLGDSDEFKNLDRQVVADWIDEGLKEHNALQNIKRQVLEYIERFDR